MLSEGAMYGWLREGCASCPWGQWPLLQSWLQRIGDGKLSFEPSVGVGIFVGIFENDAD